MQWPLLMFLFGIVGSRKAKKRDRSLFLGFATGAIFGAALLLGVPLKLKRLLK